LSILYFAYGSNLCEPRLSGRAPGTAIVGPAALQGFELRWHKRSTDGSGKCSIRASARGGRVHGVVYELPEAAKSALDRIEGLGIGYDERSVKVRLAEASIEAVTYVASPSYIDDALLPWSWYKRLVVSGAEDHRLPADYVGSLRAVAARQDPDTARAARNLAGLPGEVEQA
jgi:hypothetical protein